MYSKREMSIFRLVNVIILFCKAKFQNPFFIVTRCFQRLFVHSKLVLLRFSWYQYSCDRTLKLSMAQVLKLQLCQLGPYFYV